MITSVDFKKKLRKATTDNVSSIRLFLETEGVVTYEQIEKVVGRKDDMGRTIGGILSSLSRTNINGEPLIIPLGPSEDSRRLLWKLNPDITENPEHKRELLKVAEEVLQERL
jgi:hypothetical protein